MSLRKALITGFALSLISSSVFANEQLPCPAIAKVQSAVSRLNSATQIDLALYNTYSSFVAFKDSSLPWFIHVNNIKATNSSDALTAGKIAIKGISFIKNENAVLNDHYYYCYYGNGDIVVSSGYVSP